MLSQSSTDQPSILHHPLWPYLESSPTPADCERQLAEVIPLRRFTALSPLSTWWHRDGHLPISSLQLAATVGSPFLIESLSQSQHWVLLGHAGSATVQHPSGTCTLGANDALILPGQSWTLVSEHNSSLTAIGFDPLRLLAAARAMAPSGWSPPSMQASPLRRALPIPAEHDRSSSAVVAAISLMLPAISRVSQLGERFLEDFLLEQQLYRLIAALVFPALRNNSHEPSLEATELDIVDTRLDRVLDYISLHLDQPLSLTLLEKHSNYCRRTLHYAFQQRFSCSPMQWIRQQRMALALERLQHPEAGETVRAIATACGYHSMGRFSLDFQRTYGCKPSGVLRGKAFSPLALVSPSSSKTSSLAP